MFRDFALNNSDRDLKYNDDFTYGQLADSYALHLSQNKLLMDTLSPLKQAQLRESGKREVSRFRK
jgi:hypothetical protein